MTKKILICICLCCALVVCMACPVYAESVASDADADDWVFCFSPRVIEFEYFGYEDGWGDFSISNSSVLPLSVEYSDKVLVSIDGNNFICERRFVSFEDQRPYYYYGNISIIDPSLADTGEDFCFYTTLGLYDVIFDRYNKEPLPEGYYSGFSLRGNVQSALVSVSVPADFQPVTISTGTGVTSVLHWCGSLLNAIISPDGALFGILPVIGLSVGLALVVWGIRKFKSCTWGF